MSEFPTAECNGFTIDKQVVSEEYTDNLIKKYSPHSEDIDVALQNMDITITRLQAENERLREAIIKASAELERSAGPYDNGCAILKDIINES